MIDDYSEFLKSYIPSCDSFLDCLCIPFKVYFYILALIVVLCDFIFFRLILGGFNE